MLKRPWNDLHEPAHKRRKHMDGRNDHEVLDPSPAVALEGPALHLVQDLKELLGRVLFNSDALTALGEEATQLAQRLQKALKACASSHTRLEQQNLNVTPPRIVSSGDIRVPSSEAVKLESLKNDRPPPKPAIDASFGNVCFIHKSTNKNHNRSEARNDVTYERLELLGDAYIELIATRIINSNFPLLPIGRQVQLREMVVKNDTLAEYSRHYGFDKEVQCTPAEKSQPKAWRKILGDVFEAYLAAVVLSDPESGFAAAESWLTALWAPKLLELNAEMPTDGVTVKNGNIYDPKAKDKLQSRILSGNQSKLEYVEMGQAIHMKNIGQYLYTVGLYLTGWGYEKKLLGVGQGRNKAEAGTWAAIEAKCRNGKILDDAEAKRNEYRRAKEEDSKKKEQQHGGDAGNESGGKPHMT
ncbi:hypothetical protein LTR66_006482 [Elasticomyces elasticus]|nr:hypothetical protein LTR66_006482 [Elasticomyces elasticus]